MEYLKDKSSLMIFQKYRNMKFAYRNKEFWYKGYYVDTISKILIKINSRKTKNQLRIIILLKARIKFNLILVIL